MLIAGVNLYALALVLKLMLGWPIIVGIVVAPVIVGFYKTRGGRYTGEIDLYLYGERKAQAARDVAAARGYRMADCRAYSDSITDLPLLEAVGHPTAVNPDRALRRLAEERGWPILTFAVPVALRPRIRPVTAVLAGVGLGAALLGAGWYGHLVRRGRRSVAPAERVL